MALVQDFVGLEEEEGEEEEEAEEEERLMLTKLLPFRLIPKW